MARKTIFVHRPVLWVRGPVPEAEAWLGSGYVVKMGSTQNKKPGK